MTQPWTSAGVSAVPLGSAAPSNRTAPNAPGSPGFAADPFGFEDLSRSPTATGETDLPANEQFPANQPASWGLSGSGAEALLYVSSSSTPGALSNLRQNQLVGKIADRLGLEAVKGKSIKEQILDALADRYGVATSKAPPKNVRGGPEAASPGRRLSDGQILSAVIDKMGRQVGEQDAPPSWVMVAQGLGIDADPVVDPKSIKTTTPASVISQLGNLTRPQIAALQSLLWEGDFYDTNVENVDTSAGPDASRITPGNLDIYTMRAFGTLLAHSATAYKNGHNISWTDYLDKNAQQPPGQTQGVLNDPSAKSFSGTSLAQVISGSPKAKTITVATPDQMLNTLQTYFEQKLGRLPTTAELNQFTAEYDKVQLARADAGGYTSDNQLPVDYTDTGAELVPGVPRPAYAASAFAQSNQTEYQGHQIGAAADQLLAIMRQNGSPTAANATPTT